MATTAEIMASWQASQQQPTMNNSIMFGQTPQLPVAINMTGFNPNIANPSSGLTPAFADPMGILGSGSAGMGYMSTGDIGKQVASAPWGGVQQGASSGFGWNIPTFALGLQGLNSLGSLYMGAKSLSLANKQFESAQRFANTNLANQTHNYNDLARRRVERSGMGTGASRAEMDAEIARRKLPTQA